MTQTMGVYGTNFPGGTLVWDPPGDTVYTSESFTTTKLERFTTHMPVTSNGMMDRGAEVCINTLPFMQFMAMLQKNGELPFGWL